MQSVLIVDDNAENLHLLEVLLKGNGFAVRLAANGAQALASALKDPPDLIVSDILMPVMDGYTLCKEWQANDRLKEKPFIMYTATSTDKRDEELALSLVADRFVIKPQEPEALLGVIREALADPRSGAAGASAGSTRSESGLPTDCNEVLFRKLEKKTAELEQLVRERTAQLEAANKELEAFSYSVSHDLRAPLRAIEGFSGIVVEDYTAALDDEGRRLLGVIRTNAKRMSQLIDGLLAFSRTGRSTLRQDQLNMGAMAKSVFEEIVGDSAARARIDFTMGKLPPAEGDAALLRQVWVNLIANALKFSSRQGRPAIEISGALEKNEVVYHVRDNGVGFDMQYAGKLFGVFQRLHPLSEFEGTGIGLALVQRIVVRHGGRVWAEGAVGNGAMFSFSLPAKGAHGP